MFESLHHRILRIAEALKKRRLSIFDFDDTLVSSRSSVTVEHGDGEVTVLDSASFAYFRGTSGDHIDFSDFNNVTKPRIIKKGMDALRKAAEDSETRVVILTARPKGSVSAVQKFMEKLGLKNVEAVALASSDPMDKARWIEQNAREAEEVEFTDDSSRNVAAVETLNGKIRAKIKTNNPPHPSEGDYDGGTMGEVFISDTPTSARVDVKKDQEPEEGPSLQHTTSPWWKKQTPEFRNQYCKDHPESQYCGMKAASMRRGGVLELTNPYDGAALECDGMTRVLHTVLMRHRIPHVPMVGSVDWNGKHFNPHFWIDLPSGNVVDYRLRMWFGGKAPHGIFNPRNAGVIYEGRRANMPPLPDYLFEVLTGRPIDAGFKDVVHKIIKRVRDNELAKALIEKVRKYIQTQNPADDLTPAEVSVIYRGEEYGDDFDMPGGQELDVGWTNHAEYRCDLRDVDPSRVNEAVRNFAELHPHKHQKVNLMNHNIGKAVVEVNTTVDPEEAAVVTVMASGNDLKKQIVERAGKVKSEKAKKYVHEGLLRKIDQAGDAAGAWLEKLEADFKHLKSKGLMVGFKDGDFDDLWYIITGETQKTKKAADALLFPGQGNGGAEEYNPMTDEKMTSLFLALHTWATRKATSLPPGAPVVTQILDGLNAVEEALKGKMGLRGQEAITQLANAMEGHFTMNAPPFPALIRKYGMNAIRNVSGRFLASDKMAAFMPMKTESQKREEERRREQLKYRIPRKSGLGDTHPFGSPLRRRRDYGERDGDANVQNPQSNIEEQMPSQDIMTSRVARSKTVLSSDDPKVLAIEGRILALAKEFLG